MTKPRPEDQESPRRRRTAAAGAGMVLAAVASVLAARGLAPAYAPDAPAYRTRGPEGAKVVIVAFSDFQCPACRAAEAALVRVETRFAGQARVIFKHKPLDFHPWARDAALAAECAGRQGRFWEMHDILFERQPLWSDSPRAPEQFQSFANELGLAVLPFDACLKDPEARRVLEADLKEAASRWVHATPTFFVNGRRFVGGRQLETRGAEEALKWLK